MNIYRISQTVNNEYDTFDSAVVVAANEDAARKIHPYGYIWVDCEDEDKSSGRWSLSSWTIPKNVTAELVGIAGGNCKENTVIVASFNAG